MKQLLLTVVVLALVVGCGGAGEEAGEAPQAADQAAASGIQLEVKAPEPMAVPEYQTPSSGEDWPAIISNKNKEIVEILNIINPVAAYIVAGFEQYGDRFSPTLHEEWVDTQAQLTSAMTLYEECQGRIDSGEADKQLFLDMEAVWQLLVKTGVAGVRTKSMIDAELAAMAV